MNNYNLPELIWAITMLMWPICIIVLAILFKKDISFFIWSKYSTNKAKNELKDSKNETP